MPCRVAIKRFIENMTFPERTVKGPPQGDKFRSNVEFTLQNCLKLRDSYFRKEFKFVKLYRKVNVVQCIKFLLVLFHYINLIL